MQETDSLTLMNKKKFEFNRIFNNFIFFSPLSQFNLKHISGVALVRTSLYFALSGFLLIGCTRHSVKKTDTVTIAIGSIPSTLDPRFALDSEGMKIGSLIFQSLVKIGPNMEVIGDAAKSWNLDIKSKPNFTSEYKLNFKLKDNLIFSNGTKVSCDDIIFSIEQYKSEDSPFKSAFKNIIKTECTGSDLSLFFDSYSEKILNSDLPVIKIIPKSLIIKIIQEKQDSKSKNSNKEFKDQLVGSGPYQISRVSESEINLEANPNFIPNVKIKKLQFKVIKDDFTRFLKMYKGDLDLAVSSLPKNKILSLSKLDRLEIITKPGLSMAYLLLNLKNKELAQLKNRKIIFNGIDTEEIIKYKLEGLAKPATSILTPTNPYFWPEFNSYIKPTVDFENLRSQVMNSDLSKVVFNLKTSNTREAVENAKLIATQLRKLGFRINHESYEWGTYYKDIKQGEFDMATMTWVGAYDPDIYRIALSSKELPPDGRNRGYYSNKSFDQLIEKGEKELNPSLRKEIYYQAQKIIFDDLAIVPLWYEDTITVIDKRIKNYQPSLNGDYSGLIDAGL
jgi:peptide/nickel transport system substrate-binding protein